MDIFRRINKNKEVLLFSLILFLGSFLRLYRLAQTMQFLGDQGRDAVIARRIMMERRPALIGPVTSVGNMYLGPLYYYFMVFPLMLTYPSPVGPAYAVALLGILTLALIYVLGREMVGKTSAFIAMTLFAVSPIIIANVRFSWNPNIVPLFSLVLVWALWKAWQRQYRYWIIVGLCAAALFQLHYIALILIGCAGLFWLSSCVTQIRSHRVDSIFIQSSGIAILIFILSLTPLFLFDLRHDWLNLRAFLSFFHPSSTTQSHFRNLHDANGVLIAMLSMSARLITEFFGVVAKTTAQKSIVVVFFAYVLVRSFLGKEKTSVHLAKLLLTICLLLSVTILSLYGSSVFDHYLGFTFPIVFLSMGFVLASFWRSVFMRPLIIMIIVVVSFTSLREYPGTQQLGSTIYLFDRSSQEIAKHIPDGTSFNLLSYSPTKDLQAMNYRYFLTTLGKRPADPDDWTSFSRLVIIDEEHRDVPLDEEQYVLKIWPNRKITEQFEIVDGPRIYILDRN